MWRDGAVASRPRYPVTIRLPLCPMMRAMTPKQGQRRALAGERRTVALQPLGRERYMRSQAWLASLAASAFKEAMWF